MKKQLSILSLGLALAGFNLGFAQTKIPCNTDEAMEAHFAQDPAARANYEALQKQMHDDYLQYSQNKAANRTTAVQYTVPVVFHILHQGGPENISDATCMAALKQVNEDYARLGVDTAGIFTPFKSSYIPSDIKFMLAKKDPNGNCITGIVRHVDVKTNWLQTSANNSAAYWPYTWDPTRYLNIYIVANIVPQGTVTGNGVIVGYTYRPGTWQSGDAHDAIIYRYNYLSPAPAYDARSLSHEIGHWLGLAHTFGNSNNPGVICGSLVQLAPSVFGDGVADTPDTKGNFGVCPASSTNTNYVCTSPDPSNANLYYQNVQNFMDYSSCPKNFTTGQTNLMRSTLQSTVSGRSNVPSATNLGSGFTDVNGLGVCSPIAEFLSTTNSYTVCTGGSLSMKDFSYNGNINSWLWAADNGAVIASPTTTLTNITFNTQGVSSVTLTVTNALGSSTKVRNVTVIDGTPGVTGPYMESFEASTSLPPNWYIVNVPTTITSYWQETGAAAYDGFQCFYVDGGSAIANQVTSLQMPTLDLLNNQGCSLTFGYAYARQSATQNDVFKVQLSKDCGGTWTDVVTINANTMAQNSGGTTSVPYVPSSINEWKQVTVSDLNQYPNWALFTNLSSVMLRFTFTEGTVGNGNNFYLDAIDFSAPTGINELTKSVKLNLYPNPTTGETSLSFNLGNDASVKVSVVDVLGKEVLPTSDYQLSAGEHTLAVNKNNTLSKGVYFVNMSLNGAKMSRKLIIN